MRSGAFVCEALTVPRRPRTVGPIVNWPYKYGLVKGCFHAPRKEPRWRRGLHGAAAQAAALPAADEAAFVSQYLAPALTRARLSTVILGGDDVSVNTSCADTLLNNSATYDDLYGTAWHCHANDLSNMTMIHNSFPGRKLYDGECSTGPGIAPVNAAQLALESTYNWASGALLWNLALDTDGGFKMGSGCDNCSGLVTVDQATGVATYTEDCATGDADQAHTYSPAAELRIGGRCLDATGNGTADGTPAQLWSCTGNQKWTATANS